MMGAVFFAFGYGNFSVTPTLPSVLPGFWNQTMTNFKTPYFSRDIAEFWRRWHISLSTWFRDYLYIPLGGSRVGKWKAVRNTFAIFLVSGFWHGANWTFIVWGLIHAALFLPLLLLGQNRKNTDNTIGWPSPSQFFGMIWTFSLVVAAWVFFRAESIAQATDYLLGWMRFEGMSPSSRMLCILHNFLLIDGILRFQSSNFPLNRFVGRHIQRQLCILLAWADESTQFIYFQF